MRGTCRNPFSTCRSWGHTLHDATQRFRHQVRQRQRLGFGERERHVRESRVPNGHSGRHAQHLPVEHSGPADLVRSARQRSGLSRPPRRRRHHGGDECRDVCGRRRQSGAGRISRCTTAREPRPRELARSDVVDIGVPISTLLLSEFQDPKQRQLFKNIVYVGALSALINIDCDVLTGMVSEQYKGKDALIKPNVHALEIGRNYALDYLDNPLPIQLRRSNAVGDQIMIEGNTAVGARVRCTAVPRCAPGIRSRRRRRLPNRSSATRTVSASTRKPARRSSRSCRRKTNSPPSAW